MTSCMGLCRGGGLEGSTVMWKYLGMNLVLQTLQIPYCVSDTGNTAASKERLGVRKVV